VAIVTGIERNDVLLKFKRVQNFQQYVPEKNTYKRVEREVFCLLKLDTRRARTNGFLVRQAWMVPFLEAIRIKIIPNRHDADCNPTWIAVGTYTEQVHEDVWNASTACEIAERHYNKKVFNQSLSAILTKDPVLISPQQFQAWRNIQDDPTPEEEIEWPPEPPIDGFARYNLEPIPSYRPTVRQRRR
jgi:hypothetical protein